MITTLSDLLGPPDRILEIATGQFLFHRDSPASEIFFVESGRFRLERTTESGIAVTLSVAVAGEGLAEAALFSETYHCDAVAERRSVALAFTRSRVLNDLREDSELSFRLLRLASGRIQYLRSILELRGIRSAADRVVQYLRVRQWRGESPEPRPFKAMAEEIGLAPETFYRTLKKLEEDGVVQRDENRLWLTPDT
jgi:CRP-like cAMP-binding protein